MGLIFTLEEIANWTEEDQHVTLPNVQRGFVWKASQIENFWDSLLRGYPVGSFVLSPKKDQPNKFEMLDGQQRATALCLGFEKKTFKKDTQEHYKLFIDLELPEPSDHRDYIFRIITKSHPWGYGRNDNTKTLSSDEKRDAMVNYKKDDWLNEDLNSFFPYDASLTVPFAFLLEAAIDNLNFDQLIDNIENNWKDNTGKLMWSSVKQIWFKWIEENITDSKEDKIKYERSLEISNEKLIQKRIRAIFHAVKQMLNTQQIPALYLDFELLKQRQQFSKYDDSLQKDNELENEDDEFDNTKQTDAIENLFIRLNSGGTLLNGEDLNYSILKSGLKDERLIELIEKSCKDFIRPPRFITLAYKLYQIEKKKNDSLSMRIKPKQFQKTISETKEGETFEKYTSKLLNEKKYHGHQKTLLEYAIYLLEYKKDDFESGLPHLIVCKLAHIAPEIMFMFLYRLKHFQDEFEYGKEYHCQSLGLITMLMWLGKSEKQRDHSKVLTNIWPAINSLPTEKFWTSATLQRAILNKAMIPMPSFLRAKEGKRLINLTQNPKSNTPLWDKWRKNSDFFNFINTALFERDLIIYSQRQFLSAIFQNQEYHQEDTNMPFDWDHISPAKFIYSKKGIPRIIKECYNTIGNLRAWPYALNRTDQAVAPAVKFNPLNTDDIDFLKSKESWQKFIDSNLTIIQDITQLKPKLLSWSFCEDKKWLTLDSEDMKANWQPTFKLIMNRNFALIKNWYKAFNIENLLSFNLDPLDSILNKSKWKIINKKIADKELKEALLDEDYDVWIFKQKLSIEKININFFFQYSKSQEDLLKVDNVVFGIYSSKESNFVKSIKLSDKLKNSYSTNEKNYVHGNFTLISHEPESFRKLAEDLLLWLKLFPGSKLLKEDFNKNLLESINSKFRVKITL